MCTKLAMWRVRAGLISLLLLVGANGQAQAPAQAQAQPPAQEPLQAPPARPKPTSCANRQHIQISLGVPASYLDYVRSGRLVADSNANPVCANVVSGSSYALLDWLENGDVQTAFLSQFAVRVMKADDANAFDEEYQDFPAHALMTVPPVFRRISLLDSKGDPAPAQALVAFFDAVRKPQLSETILLPNHLSTAVPELITRARSYIAERKLTDTQRDDFLHALIAAIHFRLYRDPVTRDSTPPTLELAETFEPREKAPDAIARAFKTTATAPAAQACVMEPGFVCWSEDVLVVRRRLLDRLHGARAQLQRLAQEKKAPAPDVPTPLFGSTMKEEIALGPHIKEFRDSNYHRYQVGNLPQRYFRFNLDELWSILAHEGTPPESSTTPAEKAHMALVLTGGGVKAAYQTRMIDDLYGDGRLVNGVDPKTPDAQRVDFVIGTSGGALLGVFVSAINQGVVDAFKLSDGENLTKIIWEGIDSRDVFPFLDLPRYGTILAVYVILMLVAWVPRFHRRLRERRGLAPARPAGEAPPGSIGRLSEGIAWYALLIATPFVVIKACSFGGLEGVPPEAGVVYAAMLIIALYADVRLRRKATLTRATFTMTRTTWAAVGLFAFGVAAIVVALSLAPRDGSLPTPMQNLLALWAVCAGVTALAFAIYFFFSSQHKVFEPQPRRPIGRAFIIIVAIVIVTYLLLWIGAALRLATFLEVTGVFWMWFVPIATALSIVVVYLAHADGSTGARTREWLRSTFEYFFGEYRSWMTTFTAQRYSRFVGFGFAGWLWWNLLAAPSLYSNKNALVYFDAAFTRFSSAMSKTNDGAVIGDATRYPLMLPFVITATSLEKERELYFLFLAKDERGERRSDAVPANPLRDKKCDRQEDAQRERDGIAPDISDYPEIDQQLNDTAWSNIASDSRWFVVRKARGCDLRETAFASGSPFPVFAAHALDMAVLRTPEHLIDGGFAHNRPLEAARVLNASKVLVINSSPLEAASTSARCRVLFRMGELACNLPKLVPYLWDRSQIEDILSTKNMLVVSIYPTPDGASWPLLTDFRGQVVTRLVERARADQHQRVGVVESWGRRPVADQGGSRLLQYDTSIIQ